MAKPPLRGHTQPRLIPVQDNFLDALHTQTMEAHLMVLAKIGVDTEDIPAPDMCLVGVYMGSFGEFHKG